MKHYERVCAYIDLDAILHNMDCMKKKHCKGYKNRCGDQDRRLWTWSSPDRKAARRHSICMGLCSCNSGRSIDPASCGDAETDPDPGLYFPLFL